MILLTSTVSFSEGTFSFLGPRFTPFGHPTLRLEGSAMVDESSNAFHFDADFDGSSGLSSTASPIHDEEENKISHPQSNVTITVHVSIVPRSK